MKAFMDRDFLLDTPTAVTLFHDYAETMPIFDYHSHLSAQEILDNKAFSTITEAWLKFDHYKWRAMRTHGIPEDYITGGRSDWEKFQKWAEMMPYLIGNPLYHWTHLELQRYFGIAEPLCAANAREVYDRCNALLATDGFRVRGLLEKSRVYALYTTDDPADSLHAHAALKTAYPTVNVLPAFRPDRAVHCHKPGFAEYLDTLAEAAGMPINTLADLEQALCRRIAYFHAAGCRISDHGLDQALYLPADDAQADAVFQKARRGEPLTRDDLRRYQGHLLTCLGREYHRLGWVMQLHIGPMRNNSARMFAAVGADAGFDSMDDAPLAQDLSRLLDAMDADDRLPKTVLYCLNPKDTETLASMLGNFQGGGIPGKMQLGSAWWFNDQIDGMRRQLTALASMGMLSHFIGMLTDSRSFLSFPRHEYFRRILCSELGRLIENGEYPADIPFVGSVVQDICFNNIRRYIPAAE